MPLSAFCNGWQKWRGESGCLGQQQGDHELAASVCLTAAVGL